MPFARHIVTYQKHFKWLMAVECLIHSLKKISVTIFSDYNGLFQIKSSDDDSTTVGTPLVYGQVFKLVTVKVCSLNFVFFKWHLLHWLIFNMHIKNLFFYLNLNATFKIEMTNLFNSTYLSCNSSNSRYLFFNE